MDGRYRVLVGCVLCLVAFGVCVGYATAELRSYPDRSEIMAEPAAYDGEQVFLFTEVEAVDHERGEATILFEDERIVGVDVRERTIQREVVQTTPITIRPGDPATLEELEAGSNIQVYGTLDEGGTALDANRIVVDYQNAQDWLSVLGTSLLGAIVAVGYFFRHWRVNWRAGCFEPRGER